MTSQLTRITRGTGVLALAVALGLALLASVRSSPARAGLWQGELSSTAPHIELPIQSSAPDASQVSESYVSLYAPLPAADGPRPTACDRIGYLRFRDAAGPANPAQANAIFVAQPGIFEGASAFDQVARHTIEAAAARGYHVEFWALSRRSNCLTDTFGVQAAAAAKNPQLAMDYYYDGQTVDGQKFPGFVTEQDAAFLSHVGIAQTVQDEYTVISQLPPSVRTTKVLCGGHSLGGIVTAAFINWDFSGTGDPAYAGYNQCAGYFALDTRITFSISSAILSQSFGGALSSILSAADSGSPYINFGPFTPETFSAIPILGMASYFQPDQKNTIVSELPSDFNFDVTTRLLFANSWQDFISDNPDVRQFNFTNQAAAAFLFDDNTEAIGILRASIGVPAGGPVIERSFPLAYGSAPQFGGLVGGNDQVSPAPSSATPNGPLYRWLNYNQLPSPAPSPSDDPGHPYTSAASEVSDVTQLSRTLFDAAPAMFTEDYFPSQLVLDISAAAIGDRSGTLANLRYTNGVTQHPAAYVDAGEGITPDLGSLGAIPNGPSPQVHVVAPGYNHLDPLTAAKVQNNGQPEISSSTLASWMIQVIGPAG